jgi:hypothetical protein
MIAGYEIHEELARQTMNQFYRDGSRETLVELLKQVPFDKIPYEGSIDTTLYYFAKAAKLVPEAIQSYELLLAACRTWTPESSVGG